MNRLEEIIKNFIDEKQQIKKEIAKIEAERAQLAQQRNEKKAQKAYTQEVEAEINELGNRIAELGNQSQGLQNKLDSKYIKVKRGINTEIDSLISKAMQEMREITESKEGKEEIVQKQESRNSRYEEQKQEFFAKFGRMPNLSERAQKENQIKEEECNKNKKEIVELETQIVKLQEEVSILAKNKREFRNGNFAEIIKETTEEAKELVEETIILPFVEDIEETVEKDVEVEEFAPVEEIAEKNLEVEEFETVEETKTEELEPIGEIKVEEIEPIEEIEIEEFEPIEEIKIEEFAPIEEIEIEEFTPIKEMQIEEFVPVEETKAEEIQTIENAKPAEIEEIKEENVAQIEEIEEVKEENIEQIEEAKAEEIQAIEEKVEEIKTTEEITESGETEELETVMENYVKQKETEQVAKIEQTEKEEKEPINFGEKVTISNIIAKIKDGEVLYVASLSNGEKINVYPNRENEGKILDREKENISEIKEILINYAIAEYRTLDKKVIKKVDPVVCEILIRFAKKYNYDAQSLIYSYAMTFSKNDEVEIDAMPQITYNLYFGEDTKISKKERETLLKICKNARKNEKIEIIGYNTGLKRIKYIFKRTFNLNNNNALTEGKY